MKNDGLKVKFRVSKCFSEVYIYFRFIFKFKKRPCLSLYSHYYYEMLLECNYVLVLSALLWSRIEE